MKQYKDTISRAPKLEGETIEDTKMREMFYLNIKWFMVTLLNRKDRMSMTNSLEVRVPFADQRIVEYAYNIPRKIKFYDNREKGLLREAFKGVLPDSIVQRKKSPYPKTYNPQYTEAVCRQLNSILSDGDSPVLQIINKDKAQEIVRTRGENLSRPWYGQLMMGPQVMAYLIQINHWMKEYQVEVYN